MAIVKALRRLASGGFGLIAASDQIACDAGAMTVTETGASSSSTLPDALKNKQPLLGYTPVQQGGGAGQGANKVYLGYSNALNELKAQVDAFDFGLVWTDHATAKNLAKSGYHKFPSGLILQWSTVTNTASDFTTGYPIDFPTECFDVFPSVLYAAESNSAYTVSVDDIRKNAFNLRCRLTRNGTTQPQGSLPVMFLAVGW